MERRPSHPFLWMRRLYTRHAARSKPRPHPQDDTAPSPASRVGNAPTDMGATRRNATGAESRSPAPEESPHSDRYAYAAPSAF